MSAKPNIIAGTYGIPLRIRTDFDLSAGGVFGVPTDIEVRVVRPDGTYEDVGATIDDAVAGDISILITITMFPTAGDYEVQALATWGAITKNLPTDIAVLHVGESLWALEPPPP